MHSRISHRFHPRLGAAAAFLIALAVISLLPAPWKRRTSSSGAIHHVAHAAAFCAAALLSIRWGSARRETVAAAALLSFAASLELLQTLAYHVRFESRDVLDDGLGVAVAFAIRYGWSVVEIAIEFVCR